MSGSHQCMPARCSPCSALLRARRSILRHAELAESIKDFSHCLDLFLQKEFKRKRLPLSVLGTTVCVRTVAFDLYFKIPGASEHWPSQTLVISRIGFQARRRGCGERLLIFLADWALAHGLTHIGIECTNAESFAFGQRFGMAKTSVEGDIVTTTEALITALKMGCCGSISA